MDETARIAELKRERHEIYRTISNGTLLKKEVPEKSSLSTKIALIPLCIAGLALLIALMK